MSFRTASTVRLALVLLMVCLSTSARADVRDEVIAMLASEPRRADLIVVLDTSGSMQQHFGEVKTFVSHLARVARPGDRLTLIGFAGRATELLPPFTVRPGSEPQLIKRLNKIRPPRAQHTDLGAGMEALCDALLRPNYASLSLVFMITDFCSEPPPNSPYAGAIEGQGPCREVRLTPTLTKKSARLHAAGDQSIKTFALALEPADEAGLRAASELLGSFTRIDVGSGELERELQSVRTGIDYVRAGLSVEQILKHPPLTITAPRGPVALQGTADVEIGLLSRSPLPASVRIRSLRSLDQSVGFEVLSPHHVLDLPAASGSRKPSAATFTVRANGFESMANAVSGREIRPFEYTREVELELTLDLELAPRDSLAKLMGGPARSTATLRQKVPVRFVPPDASVVPLALSVAPSSQRLEVSPGSQAPLRVVASSLTPWAGLETQCEIEGQRTGLIKLLPGAKVETQILVVNPATRDDMRLERGVDHPLLLKGTCTAHSVARDGVRVLRGTYPFVLRATLTWREGFPYLPALLGLLALATIIVLIVREVRLRVAPVALSGKLVVYSGPSGFRQVTVPLDGLVAVALQGSPGSEDSEIRLLADQLVLPGAGPSRLELYAEKRRTMRLRLVRGEATQDDAPLAAIPVRVRKGRSHFSVGAYALRIER